MEAGLDSPIPQLDGGDVVEHLTFAFKSDYGEWDILDTLKDILPKSMTTRLISRVRIRPLEFCADHLCTVVLQSVKSHIFEWPTMEPDDAAIIFFMRHFIGFPHLLYICLFPKHNLFPHSPASLLCPSSASLTVVWLIRTGDHYVPPGSINFWVVQMVATKRKS